MSQAGLQERYDGILAEEIERAERSLLARDAERRGALRVPVVCAEMSVSIQVTVSAVNLSASGACFFADRPFSLGSRLDVSIASVFSVQATVVHCEMEDSGSELLEVHYRVHCRFDDEEEGRNLLVLAKEREGAF
jgi:hypothetical protein